MCLSTENWIKQLKTVQDLYICAPFVLFVLLAADDFAVVSNHRQEFGLWEFDSVTNKNLWPRGEVNIFSDIKKIMNKSYTFV